MHQEEMLSAFAEAGRGGHLPLVLESLFDGDALIF